MTISVWAFAFFTANVLGMRFFESVHGVGTVLLAPMSLLFLKTLLEPDGPVFRWLFRLSVILSTLLVPLVILGLDHTRVIRNISYFSPIQIIVACLYLFFSEALGGVNPRGQSDRWDFFFPTRAEMFHALRKRNTWLYLCGVLVTLFSVQDRVPKLGRTIPAVGNIGLALYFFHIKDLIMQQRMLATRRVLGRFFTSIIAALTVFLIFILITTWVKHKALLFLINAFFAAFVAAESIDPVRSLANIIYQKFFFTEASRIDILTKEASKEIAGAFHEKAIAEATKSFLQKTLRQDLICFYALDAEGKKFRKIYDSSTTLPEELPPNYPLVQHWVQEKKWKPILDSALEEEISRTTMASRQATMQLIVDSVHSLKSTIALPLSHNRSVLGFACVYALEPPTSWDDSWGVLPMLSSYFEKAGEALHELDIYAKLRNRDRLATIGEMAAGLAHEIRNPLGAIKGAVQVLDVKPGDPNEAFLKIILEETNRLNNVVSQFLNYAKPFQSEHQFSDFNQVVQEAVERFRRQKLGTGSNTIEQSFSFELRFEPSLGMPAVLCRPELISQVVQNLLENSYQALLAAAKRKDPKKSPYIFVRVIHTIRDGKVEARLTVEDSGIGMSAEVLDKIFIPFFTSSPQGTGLGLSICQKIAEAHGGRIEANSVLGEGTIMSLRFSSSLKE